MNPELKDRDAAEASHVQPSTLLHTDGWKDCSCKGLWDGEHFCVSVAWGDNKGIIEAPLIFDAAPFCADTFLQFGAFRDEAERWRRRRQTEMMGWWWWTPFLRLSFVVNKVWGESICSCIK